MAMKIKPQIVLLDVMMPEMDGIETCVKLRDNPLTKNVLIAFLTARGEDYSLIAGYEAGGDDYITKPVRPKVLVSRLKALLKRYEPNETANEVSPASIQFEDLSIDPEKHLVFIEGKEFVFPRKEFKLLMLLTSKPSRVFTRYEIFENLWGMDNNVGDRTIDVYIRKLREKLGDNRIVTIKGIGYKFKA